MVVIRLARGGRVHMPIYTLVAADSRNQARGKFLEKLGQYRPSSEEMLFDVKKERIEYWVSKGAQLSDTVKTLLKKSNIALA